MYPEEQWAEIPEYGWVGSGFEAFPGRPQWGFCGDTAA